MNFGKVAARMAKLCPSVKSYKNASKKAREVEGRFPYCTMFSDAELFKFIKSLAMWIARY